MLSQVKSILFSIVIHFKIMEIYKCQFYILEYGSQNRFTLFWVKHRYKLKGI